MPKSIIAIDPGPDKSGFVLLNETTIHNFGCIENAELLSMLVENLIASNLAIEMISSYGMAVGQEVFETCVWIGRFIQAYGSDKRVYRYTRKAVAAHICGSAKANDSNIRKALIDRLGPQGTKKKPGPTYGLKSHVWPALAVGLTHLDFTREPTLKDYDDAMTLSRAAAIARGSEPPTQRVGFA